MLFNLIFDLLFPKKCVGCNKIGDYFCKSCVLEIKQSDLICPFCEKSSIGGLLHPKCKRRYGLDGLWFLGIYKDPLRRAIAKLKYKGIKELAEKLVDILIEYWALRDPYLLNLIKKNQGKDWVLTPVPLHWMRENQRGFNQSRLLGKILSAKLGLKYEEYLKRIRYTKPQVGLESFERRKNIKGAFALKTNDQRLQPEAGPPLAEMTNVLLIDDVWTTGSTLKECCKVLKQAGAKKVWALTLAR